MQDNTAAMQTVNLIFPNQLFEFNPLFAVDGIFYLIEEVLFFRQYKFHKQKIAYHRATMKFYENYLLEKGFTVKYIEATAPAADVRILMAELHKSGVTSVAMIDPVDDWLLRRSTAACRKFNIQIRVLETPMFLNTRQELAHFFKPSKSNFLQADFYQQERIKRKILIDDSRSPVGGQWSFDIDNRKRYPKGKPVVPHEFPAKNSYLREAQEYTKTYFPDNIGSLNEAIRYPIGYTASRHWLRQFLENRLAEFGAYEDAIVYNEMLLNHSLLTPLLNTGMLTAAEVVDEVLAYSKAHSLPLNSLEGFIRQVIGWREFIRGIYHFRGRAQRIKHHWGFTRKIPASFYDGTTGIFPVDVTIRKVLKSGYCHHIERLMVLGNFMLLCEFDPDEVYRWFMEFFIDAYDWVMVPNVYGMSQFADGGMMSTKPYISDSNYLVKMSNYPKGEWKATWDALFWRFLDKQRTFFLKNPRLSMLINNFDKWEESKKNSVRKKAQQYLDSLADPAPAIGSLGF